MIYFIFIFYSPCIWDKRFEIFCKNYWSYVNWVGMYTWKTREKFQIKFQNFFSLSFRFQCFTFTILRLSIAPLTSLSLWGSRLLPSIGKDRRTQRDYIIQPIWGHKKKIRIKEKERKNIYMREYSSGEWKEKQRASSMKEYRVESGWFSWREEIAELARWSSN